MPRGLGASSHARLLSSLLAQLLVLSSCDTFKSCARCGNTKARPIGRRVELNDFGNFDDVLGAKAERLAFVLARLCQLLVEAGGPNQSPIAKANSMFQGATTVLAIAVAFVAHD
ncbi:hypothetical protein G6F24_010907 [Rhizopus arrhizus]|nr:hypothetical protein G6F24_010907 [Rhizopus arrhizus]